MTYAWLVDAILVVAAASGDPCWQDGKSSRFVEVVFVGETRAPQGDRTNAGLWLSACASRRGASPQIDRAASWIIHTDDDTSTGRHADRAGPDALVNSWRELLPGLLDATTADHGNLTVISLPQGESSPSERMSPPFVLDTSLAADEGESRPPLTGNPARADGWVRLSLGTAKASGDSRTGNIVVPAELFSAGGRAVGFASLRFERPRPRALLYTAAGLREVALTDAIIVDGTTDCDVAFTLLSGAEEAAAYAVHLDDKHCGPVGMIARATAVFRDERGRSEGFGWAHVPPFGH